jgi:hypothetical protein
MAAHMTWEQAFRHAHQQAALTGRRYRVFKSRAVVGWWNSYVIPE